MNIFEPSVAEARQVTQGDLIQIIAPDSQRYGIIVTGECDIAQRKFSNIYSYVELFSVEEYAYNYIIVPALDLLHDELPERLLELIKSDPDLGCVEPGVLRHKLFVDGETPAIASAQLSTALTDCRRALAEIELIRKSTGAFDAIRTGLETIQRLSKGIGCKAKCPTAESLLKKISADPGDLFYIGRVPEESDIKHYIASLRVVREIHKSLVFTTPSALRTAPNDRAFGKLISRLTAPYRYRLTQKLASVFSDIGLPSDFESHRSDSLKLVFQS